MLIGQGALQGIKKHPRGVKAACFDFPVSAYDPDFLEVLAIMDADGIEPLNECFAQVLLLLQLVAHGYYQ